MVPRGEVGIVVANLALATGVVDDDLFAEMLVAVVLTTVAAPYLLAWAAPRAEAETERADADPDAWRRLRPGRDRRLQHGSLRARRRAPDRQAGQPAPSAAAEQPPARVSAVGAGVAAPCCRSSSSISDWYVRPIGIRSSHSRYSRSLRAISPSVQPLYRPNVTMLPDGCRAAGRRRHAPGMPIVRAS